MLILFTVVGFAQPDWQLQKDENGIKVYTAENPESPVKLIRVEVEFDQPVEKIASTIMNVAEYKTWVYGCIESTTLARPNDSMVVYRHVTDVPWPFEDRDLVAQFTRTKNKSTGSVSISSAQIANYPEQEGYSRVKSSKAIWVLTPQKSGTVKAVYQLSVDPGGNMPGWLINLFITEGPYETFVNLQNLLRD
jgi:hypothetical protein